MKTLFNNLVCFWSGMRDPTWDLFHVEPALIAIIEGEKIVSEPCLAIVKRKPRRRFIAPLDLAPREIDRPAVEAAGGPSLESANLETQASKIFAQTRTRVSHTPTWLLTLSYVKQAPQKRTRCNDYGAGSD
jgi:hypothetical protein